uniref:Sulfotransferase n=1 Tax=Electrophorus electricus TaxID=8005 RepID=A0A4W4EX94_ELEEL
PMSFFCFNFVLLSPFTHSVIIPLVLNGGDLTPVQTIPNWDRVPWLEETRAAVVMDKLSSPRAIVSHMPYHLMPSTFFSSKVIYIARNPKDVFVSSFHFHNMSSFLYNPGTFEEFADKLLAGQEDRILYITYEELIQVIFNIEFKYLIIVGNHIHTDIFGMQTDFFTCSIAVFIPKLQELTDNLL